MWRLKPPLQLHHVNRCQPLRQASACQKAEQCWQRLACANQHRRSAVRKRRKQSRLHDLASCTRSDTSAAAAGLILAAPAARPYCSPAYMTFANLKSPFAGVRPVVRAQPNRLCGLGGGLGEAGRVAVHELLKPPDLADGPVADLRALVVLLNLDVQAGDALAISRRGATSVLDQ